MRVARVQGVNISPNLGQTQQADQTEQKAQALIDSVLESQPSNRIALLRAGQIAHDRMILAGDGHHDEQALQFAGAAVDRLTRYQQVATLDTSTDRNEAQQVIIAFTNVANRLMIADRFEEARRTANRGIEIARATNWPTQAGAALMIVALSYRAEGDLDSALRAVRESVRLLEPVNGEKSTGRLQSYGLALIREAQILGEDQAISLNRPAEAIGILERALEMGREFARRDPADFQSQNRMFTAETKLARIVRYAEPARALDLYDDALGRLSAMGANAATLRNEAATLAASTYPLVRLGRRAEARKRLDDALEKVARLGQYPADEVELGSAADDTLRALAEYEAAGGNSRRAAALYDDLLRLIFVAKPQPETSLEDAVELTVIYAGAAQQHRRAGEPDAASRIETGRIDLWRHWDARLPNNPFVRRQLDAARAR
jgi:tetratricopeptide (TPR) repeat protein